MSISTFVSTKVNSDLARKIIENRNNLNNTLHARVQFKELKRKDVKHLLQNNDLTELNHFTNTVCDAKLDVRVMTLFSLDNNFNLF